MSAFVVQDKTINTVVSYLVMTKEWYTHKLTDMGYDLEKKLSVEKLAKDMFFLNCEAVDARYGKGEAEKFRPLDFKYCFTCTVNAYMAMKSLSCWLYQCSEGNIDKSPLYITMKEIEGDIAKEIVCKMPQYENAECWK